MNLTICTLIAELHGKGAVFATTEDGLDIEAPEALLTENVLNTLRRYRNDIPDLVSGEQLLLAQDLEELDLLPEDSNYIQAHLMRLDSFERNLVLRGYRELWMDNLDSPEGPRFRANTWLRETYPLSKGSYDNRNWLRA